jgi:hypothetical protein
MSNPPLKALSLVNGWGRYTFLVLAVLEVELRALY